MASKSRLSLLTIVIVGIVIAGSIGSYLLTSQTPQTAQMTTTQRVTSKPAVFFKLFGKIFFDYNGNGKQDRGESDLSDVVVALDDKNATSTNSTGCYVIDRVVEGNHTIRPYPPKNFRYMCESTSELRSTRESYEISVTNVTRKDIGLMEGFLTHPVLSNTVFISNRLMYDWEPAPQHSLWWNGKPGIDPNNHKGHDYDMNDGTPVLAAAPGKIVFVGEDSAGKGILIEHYAYSIDGYHRFYTDYWHLSEFQVKVGQFVSRGEIIAKSGHTYNQHPHLHFALYRDGNTPGCKVLDPYRPVFEMAYSSNGYWTLEPNNTYGQIWVPWTSDQTNPNFLGYWTRDNDPQFPQ